jgi:hypothetical protein
MYGVVYGFFFILAPLGSTRGSPKLRFSGKGVDLSGQAG